MDNKRKCSDPSVQVFCGDKVAYPECFGDKELIFVGMAKQLKFNNDCIVTYEGKPCPVRRAGLIKLDNR